MSVWFWGMGLIILVVGLVGLAIAFPPLWFVYLVIVGIHMVDGQ